MAVVTAIKQIQAVRGKLYGLDESGALWRLVEDDPAGERWTRVPSPS